MRISDWSSDVCSSDLEATVVPVLHWVSSGALQFNWELRVDTLTAVMLVVITTESALVHLYSWGYMEEDPDQPRFFAYLSLFTFAMLMLVTANNHVQMFLRSDEHTYELKSLMRISYAV